MPTDVTVSDTVGWSKTL